MLDKYKDIQSVFYNYINLSFKNDRVSHAYLIEHNGVNYSDELAVSLAKFFICDGVFDEDICHLIDNDNYPGFLVIDGDKGIKKDEILKLQKLFSLKSVDNRRMVYLIRDVSLLNKYSANSLLKFLEEPCEGIVAILMCDNINKVMDTISSRCQIINLVNDNTFDYRNIFDVYYNELLGDYDFFVDNEMKSFFNFYENLESKGTDVLVFDDPYVFNDRLQSLLFFGIYLYFDVLNVLLDRNKDSYLPSSLFVEKVITNNEINDIIYKIDVINDFLNIIKFNVNPNLVMDNFIISMGG